MVYKTLLCTDSSRNSCVNKEETCLLEDTLRTRGQLFSDYLGGIGVRTNMGFGPKTGTWGQEQDMSRTCPGLVQLSRHALTTLSSSRATADEAISLRQGQGSRRVAP